MTTVTGPNIRHLQVDVTEQESIQAAVDEVYRQVGRIDILISNAGVHCTGPVLDITIEHAQRTYDTNVFGLMRLCKTIVPQMAERRIGLVVVIGSVRSELPTPFAGIYSSSKAAVRSYTETLSMECQPLGVNVMLINPGSVTSNIVKNQGTYQAPEKSLYKNFSDAITHVMMQSQSKKYNTMDTMEFAQRVSEKILAKKPPRYMCLGGATTLIKMLQLLPRQWALQLLWLVLSRAKP
ncbi:NADPH-dependent 1-acyl dihydroxyacetone phosphate reductase [Paramarasmius palmivorus]|uniref:NADPH-dependent 1-acyl dihydroxyacetone phosphate reductase n=1 Tax=Paramarasmius palmivorus TaxID=297713 RepID=A0AAW0BRG1_9AGAR